MFSQSKAKDPTVAISRNSPVPKRTKSCDGTIFSMKPMENILFVHYDEPVVVDFKTDKSKFRGFPKVIT